ncbi:YccF domain-containing protein [Kitasatospora cineracea]|uniref:YccF domain-containing protein n=1 Tax=Kitasatospora cineracea TaxID=88074 RepID=UPI00342E8550
MKLVNFLLNVIWLLFCGLWMAIGYAVAGIVCFVLIVTIPFGIAAFRLAGFMLWPFGRTTVVRDDAGAPSCVGNVIWLVLAGWWLALGHIVTSIPLFLSIIGIPFGWANLKMVPISLTPLGRDVVSTDRGFGSH